MNTYKINTICRNCGARHENFGYADNRVEIPKGKPYVEIECPTCGCKALSKISQP